MPASLNETQQTRIYRSFENFLYGISQIQIDDTKRREQIDGSRKTLQQHVSTGVSQSLHVQEAMLEYLRYVNMKLHSTFRKLRFQSYSFLIFRISPPRTPSSSEATLPLSLLCCSIATAARSSSANCSRKRSLADFTRSSTEHRKDTEIEGALSSTSQDK